MNNTFPDSEKLYRAVFPESYIQMFWRRDGTVSSAAFTDKYGLSVELSKSQRKRLADAAKIVSRE